MSAEGLYIVEVVIAGLLIGGSVALFTYAFLEWKFGGRR